MSPKKELLWGLWASPKPESLESISEAQPEGLKCRSQVVGSGLWGLGFRVLGF